jgi:hypothetical protein
MTKHIVGNTVYEGENPVYRQFEVDPSTGKPAKDEAGMFVPFRPAIAARGVWLKVSKGVPWRRKSDADPIKKTKKV